MSMVICQWLAVDCGMGFADERYPGIDILLPDPKFIADRRKELVGLIITHAHEDHIGAVAHLWPRLKCPIYCTPFTASVLRRKLSENHNCRDAEIIEVELNGKITLKPLRSLSHLSHTPYLRPRRCSSKHRQGTSCTVATGTLTPIQRSIARPRQAVPEIREKGVLAYIGDSTMAEVEGHLDRKAMSNAVWAELFRECEGRIAITMFASNIGRLRSICLAARQTGRQVALIGRSLHNMTAAAKECGYLKDVPEFVTEDDLGYIPDHKLIIVVTGSQVRRGRNWRE